MNTLRIDVDTTERLARVVLRGDLTEHADFSAVTAVTAPELVFDLRDVRRINSCGVREWIRLMDALRAAGRSLVLEHCSVAFVSQMNMIVNFRGGARVASFYAPYLCTACGREFATLCELSGAPSMTLPDSAPCPHCGATGEFDDLPETFLSFAR